MANMLNVSASPHVRDKNSTSRLMTTVIVALLPATIFGVCNFGLYSLLIIAVSIASSVATEFVYEKLMHKPVTVGDMSAALTGLLIGLNMPPTIYWWIPVIGSIFAIIFIKQLYGGLGQNFMNPALGARCFLLISFASEMTNYTVGNGFTNIVTDPIAGVDVISGATPLAYLSNGSHFNLMEMFLGRTTGVIGETSALCLLVGGIFLIAMKVIDFRIPLAYLGSFAVFVFITCLVRGYADPLYFTAEELCGGGIMLGAFFMATDYVTSPITKNGRIVYGVLLGLLTWLFRMVSKSSEGVSYAIIFVNMLVPMIENYTRPRALGVFKIKKDKAAKAPAETGKEAAK